MAFTAKNQRPAEPPEERQDDISESDSVGFLNPKKSLEKAHPNDPYGLEMSQKSTNQYTLKTLNALKIVSPIICALMEKPGVDAPNEEMSESFRHLIKETSSIAEVLCEKMGIDPTKEKNFWIRNVIEKNFAEILRIQWTNSGKTNISQISNLFDEVLKVSETTAETSHYDELSPLNNVKMATFRAIMPILTEATTSFDLYRNLEQDIEPITQKLFDVSAKAVEKLADDYADSSNRAKLFYMIIQEAGTLYAAAWRAETKKISEIMEQHSKDRIEKTIEKYKNTGGFPLNRIEHDFEKYFSKMMVITEKLVQSQKGTIDKRLKNK